MNRFMGEAAAEGRERKGLFRGSRGMERLMRVVGRFCSVFCDGIGVGVWLVVFRCVGTGLEDVVDHA